MSSPCEECVQVCEQGTCELSLTEQCTEQCVVVPCNDVHHDYSLCEAANAIAGCDIMCTDGPDCDAIDTILQCCPEYHQLFVEQRPQPSQHGTFSWPFSPDNSLHGYMNHDSSLYGNESSSSTPQLANSPVSMTHTPHSAMSSISPSHPPPISAPQGQGMPGHQTSSMFTCMWGNCGATFHTLNELVGHVNLQHLRLPTSNVAPPAIPQPSSSQHLRRTDALSCMWADCQVYSTPSSVPGPSIGDQANNALGVLASHLLQDHLGLSTPAPTVHSDDATQVSPPASGPPTPAPEHDCSAPQAHVCRWVGCGESFASCDALTQHINAAHVGSGKAHYDCYWEGCSRHGDSGFASKQKICRHLQSHTGHRPFQCSICQQNFSEAATLAQHMRRHTQESAYPLLPLYLDILIITSPEPYVCDYPGCGKSFAITGALTIHKRTHNGEKPFKCTFCERAFTESSNLSKHLRTHTGHRPYPCAEPGCNKTFARPDQLARHMTVHRKKDVKPEPAEREGQVAA
ncbi:uncharacterized protein PHACADRAFT_166508 [Phanerochaete carnosa HHB-10118-sp]|uniref:C2H2-type domain-containing protein n=1 Tax=Phanerochaete carnosa (strain HHB-10118-sp) TaxID=650164 RepID=K5VFK1_PHACS|nr:uncharacterized protein PHACADRAFT_166508 [Phanerochaete carnosa HHB-10118-sp]EKM49933.1 hypothetical protein PHACADRAFT_166508 [Phanerochaete carnosa HHB-10118-sp]